ncbi:DUF1828 domain-containing protein [Marinobacter sp. BGYM27]|uniref:DUF1828 domain-containing protein n=1 Tax=Marinobacter sp. BGYM27 TaxID=2975597 RepID=UPI0021A34AA0|nr:DUF1828 domain-containing protein [Marinobacter sp. BGYM27]MDG5498933.1 DUF1828 domain-containing protein [Marinobacter sp. BGYM27]
MKTEFLKSELCKAFSVAEAELNSLYVTTPFSYEDGDSVVVFVTPLKDGSYRVDDNGEAAYRLAIDGIDLDNAKPQAWLQSIRERYGIQWDEADEELFVHASSPDIVAKMAMRVAECSVQMQALTALRVERQLSSFKDDVLAVLREIENETQVTVKYDISIDPDQQFKVDAYFLTSTPVAVVIASSVERLLEAELIWTNCHYRKEPLRLFAVVEDTDKISAKQVMRANYYTDKTVQFKNMSTAFHDLVHDAVKAPRH